MTFGLLLLQTIQKLQQQACKLYNKYITQ